MNPEMLKQDFESALVKHMAFKARLRSFLYGNGTSEGPLRDPEQCTLGQWISERRRGAYSHVLEMAELDQQHHFIHQQANALMDQFRSGEQAAARAGFATVQGTADYMVQLLQTIEARLRTAGAEG